VAYGLLYQLLYGMARAIQNTVKIALTSTSPRGARMARHWQPALTHPR
jgi:hypothetical protein